MSRTILILSMLALASCHKDEPPAPTPEQSAQLNDADSMLNNLDNEEGPEANAPGPSNSSD
jgi:nitrous oxide reductase accessory protein NosL